MSLDDFDAPSATGSLVNDVYSIDVKGQSFAIGLFWGNYESGANGAKEARSMAAKPHIDGDLYCVRDKAEQFGIGHKANGHAKGQVSLAGALADARGGSWVGLFAVGTGYYLLAVRDGDILADTDKFIDDEMHARSRLEDVLSASEWGNVFVPDGFDIEGATIASLDEMVDKPRKPRLQSTDQVGGALKLGVGAAVVLALVFGGMFYINYQNDLQMQQQLEALSQSFNNSAQEEKIVIPPMPWEGKPTAVSYLNGCIAGMNRATLSIPGWDTVGLACEGNSVNMVLQRTADLADGGGPISWVHWAVEEIGLVGASVTNVDDNQVLVAWSFDPGETYPVVVDTAQLATVERYLRLKFEDLFTPISFGGGAGASSSQFVASKSFTFRTPFQPTEFDAVIREVPGLTIDRVVLDLTELDYRIDGSIHEQLIFPETGNAQLN